MIQLFKDFRYAFPRFLKYQILTKLPFGIFILPLFFIISELLLESKGLNAISNANLMQFILSYQGAILSCSWLLYSC